MTGANGQQNGLGAFILQCRKMDFHFCDWAGSSRGMKCVFLHLALSPNLSGPPCPFIVGKPAVLTKRKRKQRLHKIPALQVRVREPRGRDHGVAAPGQAPGHRGALRQRQTEVDLRAQHGAAAGAAEGAAAARRERREAEEGDEARVEYQPQCQGRVESVSRDGDAGVRGLLGFVVLYV